MTKAHEQLPNATYMEIHLLVTDGSSQNDNDSLVKLAVNMAMEYLVRA